MTTNPPGNHTVYVYTPPAPNGTEGRPSLPVKSAEHFHHESASATQTVGKGRWPGVHGPYHRLLDLVSKKPVHASHSFPFEWNGYDSVKLLSQESRWSVRNETGKSTKSPSERLSRKISGVYQVSLQSARSIVKNGFWGGVFGFSTGLLISGIRFRWGIPEMLNKQKFLGLLMMPGLPLLGGLIGAASGFITGTRHQAKQLNQAFQNLMDFN